MQTYTVTVVYTIRGQVFEEVIGTGLDAAARDAAVAMLWRHGIRGERVQVTASWR